VDHVNHLTIKVVRDGRICVLTLSGDLDFLAVPGFLIYAAQVIDEPTERFVLDLGGLTFLDCAGARALAAVTNLLPSGCPVIIRSLSPAARQILDLLDMDLRQEPSVEDAHGAGLFGQPGGSVPLSQRARPAGRPAARLRAGER
jgi:anti-anti-sigma factor